MNYNEQKELDLFIESIPDFSFGTKAVIRPLPNRGIPNPQLAKIKTLKNFKDYILNCGEVILK